MSMDIGVLLEMEGFDGSTGISPTQTLFSGHSANPSTSLSVSLVRSYIDEGPGPSSSTPNVKGRISTSRTPVSRSHLLSMTNINDHDEQTLGILIESDQKIEHGAHSSSRQWTQLSGSPNRTAEAFVSSPLCSSPTSVFQMTPFTLPRSYSSGLGVSPLGTLVSTKHAMGGHASKHSVDNRSSPRESGEDLQWQMYLTTSLSNPFDFCDSPTRVNPPLTSNYPSYSGDSYSVSHEVTSEDSTSLSTSDLDPFSALSNGMAIKPNVLHPDPYELEMGIMPARPEGFSPSRNLGDFLIQEPSEHMDSTVNDQTLPMSNETYSVLMELTPPTFEFGSARFSSIEAPSVARDVSPPLRDMSPSPRRGRSPTLSRRGLSGWESTDGPDHLQASFSNKSLIPEARKRKSSPLSSSVDSSRDCKPTPLNSTSGFGLPRKDFLALNAIPSTNAHGHGLKSQVKEQHVKDRRVRQDFDPDSDELDKFPHRYDDSESDDYRPSRSPSPDSFSAPSSHALVVAACKSSKESRGGLEEVNRLIPRKKAKRGKGKAKGSAALALAVVTQLKTKSRSRSLGLNDDEGEDEYDAMTLYQQGKTGIRKRKNHPIPLPVPIPNLNKKSRGRKVPFVADPELLNRSQGVTSSPNSSAFGVNIKGETVEVNMADGSGVEDLLVSRSSRRVRRKVTTVAPTSMTNADELSGARSYVCVVPGCGKCFVRGEHLKRHVRSIHTHDKPHPCPYEGCDKSFSRRDNLGQHVRIHLQP